MRRFSDQMGWAVDRGGFAIGAAVDERLGFLRRTYSLLTVQILGVGGIAALVMNTPFLLENIAVRLISSFPIYIISFLALSFLTRRMLAGHKPLAVQYGAAALWTFFLGLLVSPLLYVAQRDFGGLRIVGEAFVLTAAIFGGLTAYVLTTRKDFSFVGGAIWIASWVLVAVGGVLWFTGSAGGIWYSLLWVALLSVWTLYDTSKILHHRRVDEAVAASVDLLLDFVFLFIHLLSILMSSRN